MRATLIGIIIIICFLTFVSGKAGTAYNNYRVLKSGIVPVTAYNSMPGQTDSTPWTTASGTRCREGVIAANFLPIGTKVMIEGFGNQIFTVEDRMNKRYKKRIDIWFRSYNDARKFGVREIKYYIIDA